MMQSILMAPGSNTDLKAGKLESGADLKKEASTSETGKSSNLFSELLESALGKNQGDASLLKEASLKEGSQLEEASDTETSEDAEGSDDLALSIEVSSDVALEDESQISLEGNEGSDEPAVNEPVTNELVANELVVQSDEHDVRADSVDIDDAQDASDTRESMDGSDTFDTLDPLYVNSPVDNQNKTSASQADLNSSANNPLNVEAQGSTLNTETARLLAKIEAAQKMDTKVTNVGEGDEASTEDVDEKSFKALLLDADKNTLPKDKELLSALVEKSSNKEEQDKSMGMLKAQAAVATLENKDKPELVSTFKAETLHGMSQLDNDSSKHRQVSSLDKLANLGVTNEKQNALEKPFELHAKQASEMLGKRILMMISQGKQEVSIRLDPAELGSMHIKLVIQQDQLQLHIQTQHGQSRDLIEQHLPRLREQLAQQGINLNASNVEQHAQQQSQQQNQQQQNATMHQQDSQLSASMANISLSADEQMSLMGAKTVGSAQGIDFYA
ncbi:flagellar hook-length control protein [Psychromonas sp. CNPT3]|uniref:flagellar hook-length control protein FliK n=1 Tax=Psychromonas sp. CNPT3 TaxID=314282 RepID=UPI00006E78ED|nr:flagellar hook-length control protein FliK [Psychromonas sp. CNPT3]AGH82053.1 flagellar hook-length control protein [Psychromonas sp. CNPT3]